MRAQDPQDGRVSMVDRSVIRTPDQRLRVFVSSTLGELAPERAAVRAAITELRLSAVMFELGARPHPPRALYRAYVAQSDIFVGVYWERYGWIAPGEEVSGLEDEYRLARDLPRLLYIKEPTDARDDRLQTLIRSFADDDMASYKRFTTTEQLQELVANDLAVMLSERFGRSEVAPATSRNHIPHPPAPIFGRAAEADAVLARIRGGARLVTLTGVGGIGKSRLALDVAHRLGNELDICVVSLSDTESAGRALRVVAEQLGARGERDDPVEEIVTTLGSRRMLLVLDNLEQIAGLETPLAALIERAPGLQVLATTRRALRLRAEEEVRLTGLAVPADGLEAATIAASPAVQLFLERCARVGADPDRSPATMADIAAICRRVDGIPLAIELAASRMRLLSPAALLARLDDQLTILAGGSADLPPRQRSLRATIAWSEALLEAPARALLRRLAIFRGGWTMDAAEAISRDEGDTLDVHAQLVDASLVTVDTCGGNARFAMLETVRAYALEQLRATGAHDEAADAHLDHFLELAARAKPALCGPGQRQWVDRLDPERANLSSAVAWALASGRQSDVVSLTWDVIVLYFVRDAVDEPAAWLNAVAEASVPLEDRTAARLRSLRALTRIHHGDYRDVDDDLREPLAFFRSSDMSFEAAVALHQLGFVRYRLHEDVHGAIEALRESSSLFDGVAHDWGVALAEAMLGSIFAAQGDIERAEACQQRSLARARVIDNEPLVAQALEQLAFIRLLDRRDEEAFALLEEAVPILVRNALRTDSTYALDALALLALGADDADTAALAVSVAQSVRARLGVSPWPSVEASIDRVARGVERRVGPEEFARRRRNAEQADPFETLLVVAARLRSLRTPEPASAGEDSGQVAIEGTCQGSRQNGIESVTPS